MFLERLECTECESTADAGHLATVCPACGMPLVARYDLERAGAALSRDELTTRPGGLWRLREVLPAVESGAGA